MTEGYSNYRPPEAESFSVDDAAQQAHENRVHTQAAGRELLSRFSELDPRAVPAEPTKQQFEAEAAARRDEEQIDTMRRELTHKQAQTRGMRPELISPAITDRISELQSAIQQLEAQRPPALPQREEWQAPTNHSLSAEYRPYIQNPDAPKAEQVLLPGLGNEKLKNLFDQEREVVKAWGEQLGRRDSQTIPLADKPRSTLRRELMTDLVETFMLNREQRAILELQNSSEGEIDPTHVYQQIERTIRSANEDLRASSNAIYDGGVYPIMPRNFNQDPTGEDAFLLSLLAENRNRVIHPDTPLQSDQNVIRYQAIEKKQSAPWERQEEATTGRYGSLTTLFTRYPDIAREVALIQAAEKQSGERPSLFAASVHPNYEIKQSGNPDEPTPDEIEIQVLRHKFETVNEQRRANTEEQRARIDAIRDIMAEMSALHGRYEIVQRARQSLEAANREVESAQENVNRAQDYFNSVPVPERNFLGFQNRDQKRIYNEAEEELANAQDLLDTKQEVADHYRPIVEAHDQQWQTIQSRLADIDYPTNTTITILERDLPYQEQRLRELESITPKARQ